MLATLLGGLVWGVTAALPDVKLYRVLESNVVLLDLLTGSVISWTMRWLVVAAIYVGVFLIVRSRGVSDRTSTTVATATALALPGLLLADVVNHWLLPGFRHPLTLVGNLLLLVMSVPTVLLLARLALRAMERPERTSRLDALIVTMILGLALGTGVVRVAERSSERTPVLIILIDALRADHLGAYGYERDTTPNLDRLAADSVLFERAISQATFTKASIASLLTGLYPHRHGVYTGNKEDQPGQITSDLLRDELETLPEILLDRGFLTAAWVRNPHLMSYFGFDQGFIEYHDTHRSRWSHLVTKLFYRLFGSRDGSDRPARVQFLLSRYLSWQERIARRYPSFGYIHLLDLHDPYQPPPGYDRMFGTFEEDIYRDIDLDRWGEFLKDVRTGRRELEESTVEQLKAYYDGELRLIDEKLGWFFEQLKEADLYDRSLLIVTSDHGDGFMEHGFISHSYRPYEELLRVPLLMKLPGQVSAGLRISSPVALVDLVPTILDLLAIDIPVGLDGRVMLDLVDRQGREKQRIAGERIIISESGSATAVQDSTWKLLRLGAGKYELYNLKRDPGERVDLSQTESLKLEELEPWIERVETKRSEQVVPTRDLEEETIEELKRLGYIE
ncbi:MAG: sulfatase [Thermoanaerobaculia bacterium]